MRCSIINYSYCAVHHIPLTYLLYNWNFVHSTLLTCFAHSSVFVFLCLTYFTYQNALKVHPCCHSWQGVLFYS